MKKIVGFSVCILLFMSCNSDIVFTKDNEEFNYSVTLKRDNTFSALAQFKDVDPYDEKGTFEIKDSILILDYTNEFHKTSASVVKLQNDTFLVLNYNEQIVLYPFYKQVSSRQTSTEMMINILDDYTSDMFEQRIGKDFLVKTKGDFSKIYSGKSFISPYYDRFLKQ